MSSMKANIERAAELLNVPVDALTGYLLERNPDDPVEEEQRERVVTASQLVGVERTLLLLGVVDIVRAGDPSGCDEHRAEIAASKTRAEMRETSAITEANRAGIAIRALALIRKAVDGSDGRGAHARLTDVLAALTAAGY